MVVPEEKNPATLLRILKRKKKKEFAALALKSRCQMLFFSHFSYLRDLVFISDAIQLREVFFVYLLAVSRKKYFL